MLVPAGNMDSDDEVRATKRMGYLALDDQCIIIHAFCPACTRSAATPARFNGSQPVAPVPTCRAIETADSRPRRPRRRRSGRDIPGPRWRSDHAHPRSRSSILVETAERVLGQRRHPPCQQSFSFPLTASTVSELTRQGGPGEQRLSMFARRAPRILYRAPPSQALPAQREIFPISKMP